MSKNCNIHFIHSQLSNDDWPKIFSSLKEIEEKCLQDKVTFRNKDYPLYPSLVILESHLRQKAKYISERLMELLERVITICRFEKENLDFFMLNNEQKRLCLLPSFVSKKIVISRFDTFLNIKEGSFKILENNTDCPAGVIFTGRIMKIIKNVTTLQNIIEECSVNEDPITLDLTFLRHLLNAYDEFDGTKVPNIGILQIKDKYSPETHAMKEAFKKVGINARIVDPRTLSYSNGKLYDNDFPIHLIWNKINTVYFDPLLKESRDELGPFLQAVHDGSVCHLNSFAARYITESKLCHAFLWEAQSYFSKEEQDFIHEVIPWSVKMQPRPVYYKGEKKDLVEIALRYRTELVLKAAYDIRGDGVLIGRSCSPEEWERQIKLSLGKPFILQEYVIPPELPVMTSPSSTPQNKKFSIDMFMFNGKLQGFGSKVSDSNKLNIFQGGSKNAVFSI